jgi:hypothetical protein
MSKTSHLSTFLYADETEWAEDVHTWDAAIAVTAPVSPSGLDQQQVATEHVVSYHSDEGGYYPGTMGGSFSTTFHLPGHGTPTDSTVTANSEHEKLLGYAVGNCTASAAGTTINGSSTATSLAVALASGYLAGDIIYVGVKGDGRGDGQAAVVDTHGTGTITLKTALPGSPQSGDVVYGSVLVYPYELPSTSTVTPIRGAMLSANQGYEAHGCHATALSIEGTNTNESPKANITWGISWFEDSDEAFPSATVPAWNTTPAPNNGGSFFLQDFGTDTRAEYDIRSFKITTELGMMPQGSPGGVMQYQGITSAVRGKQVTTIEVTIDAGSASLTPTWVTRWLANANYADAHYHLLYTFNGAHSGKRVAIYAPHACLVGARPVQMDDGGVNRITLTFRCKTNTVRTTDRVASAWRIAFG